MGVQLAIYVLKRVLVMIPTLFVIALICFVVLNLAPGKPGKAGEAAQASGSEEARMQYRLFKEQFNIDKPVILNTYFMVTEEEVQELLQVTVAGASMGTAAGAGGKPAAIAQIGKFLSSGEPELKEKGTKQLISLALGGGAKEVIDAQNQLEDWGDYVVPHLISVMNSTKDVEVRKLAIYQLSINGQLRNLFLGRENEIPDEIKEEQVRIGRHNQKVSRWKAGADASEEELAELQQNWNDWYAESESRFTLSDGDKFSILFTDTRFYKYMSNLLKGDFGFTQKREPVLPEILKRLKYSFTLSLLSVFLIYLLSIPIGIFSAIRQNTFVDQLITLTLFILYSLPTFFVGTLIVQYIPNGEPFFTNGFETSKVADPFLSSHARIWDIALHLVLPVFCMTYGGLATLSRYARTGLLDVIRADYIRTARAKGLSEGVVIMKHAVRNGMIPILTILGTLLPFLFGGSIVIEYIFEIDGIGRYMLQAIYLRDFTVIMGVLLISAVMTLIGLLISDISYALVDPRITFD